MRNLLSIAVSALLFASSINPSHAAVVAGVDTGIDPGALSGGLSGPGFNFFGNNDNATDDQPAFHGTSSAASGRQTVPSIQFLPIKVYGSNFETNPGVLDAAFNFVAAQPGVLAVSHSIGSINEASLASLQAVTNAGKVLVIQAGNTGAANPSGDAAKVPALGGRGVIAGGVVGNTIWPSSNLAGSFQEFYLTAEVVAPINGWIGTSMSTARIAAVAATVAEAFPFMSSEQVVQVLFQSATDLGDPGIDGVYGNGLVNLSAAMTAVGQGTIPAADSTSTTSSGGGGGGGGSGLALGALAIGGAVFYSTYNKKEDLKKTIFVDKFGRGFNVDLSARTTTKSNTPVFGLFSARQNPITVTPMSTGEFSQTFALVQDPYSSNRPEFSFEPDETRQISFRHYTDTGAQDYAMGLNADLSGEFGALSFANKASSKRPSGQFLYNQVFTTPVLGYSSQGSTFKFGWNGDQKSHRLGLSVIDDQEINGIQSNSVLYENRVEKDKVQLGFQIGALLEQGNLLGGASDGAFSTDNTNTYYIGFNGSWDLTPRVSLIGGYFQGMSKVDEADQSLLDQFSDIRTEGYGVGLMVNRAFSPRGNFGLSYSSPMQATSGSARLTLPTSQDRNTGAIRFERSSLSFEDGDQEKIVEAYYGYRINPKSDVFAHYSYTKNPVSEPDLDQDNTFYVGWKRRF